MGWLTSYLHGLLSVNNGLVSYQRTMGWLTSYLHGLLSVNNGLVDELLAQSLISEQWAG